MKKNKFPYKSSKKFSSECQGYIGYRVNDEFDEKCSKDDFNNFIDTVNCIYDFTKDNLDLIYNKGLKYPTKYIIEVLRNITYGGRYEIDKELLILITNSIIDINNIYRSLFDKNRSKLVNYYYNGILLYQYDKRLITHLYDSNLKGSVDCNHHYLIDLDDIADKYGIYKLYDDNMQLVYIGKSYALGIRIQQSLKVRGCKYYSYCIIETKSDTDSYETYYISKLKPKYNIIDINTNVSIIKLKDDLVFSNIKSPYPVCVDLNRINDIQISSYAYNISKEMGLI